MDQKVSEEEEEWGKCLVAEARTIDVMISINLKRLDQRSIIYYSQSHGEARN